MSNLQSLIMKAKNGLSIQQRIPDAKWKEIAAQCGPSEIAEIEERIKSLRAELEAVEDWDGDTQDDINLAISQFKNILEMTRN